MVKTLSLQFKADSRKGTVVTGKFMTRIFMVKGLEQNMVGLNSFVRESQRLENSVTNLSALS